LSAIPVLVLKQLPSPEIAISQGLRAVLAEGVQS